ncbi:putative peptidase M24, creatinase/aminopeptidase [Plasmopara halstedii]
MCKLRCVTSLEKVSIYRYYSNLRGINSILQSYQFLNQIVIISMRRYFSRFTSRSRVVAGDQTPQRSVPNYILHPHYAASGNMSNVKPFIPILDYDQQQQLRATCALAKDIREFARPLCEPGITTEDIDRLVHEEIVRRGAYPSPLNYGGFPKSLCSSVNDIVVHGIPDSRLLEDGDIVNIDISVYLNGFHGDTSQTFTVGNVDEAGKHLIHVTNQALVGSIDKCCKPLNRFAMIGNFIQNLAEQEGLGVVQEYTGHGIGQEFHCLPYILHHRNDEPAKMLPGMAFTVEPALTEGDPQIEHWDDGWTVATVDGGRSAQAEHTLLITEDGVEILTM